MVFREIICGLIPYLITGGLFTIVDYPWALWDKDRQTLHDKMVGSWVVAWLSDESLLHDWFATDDTPNKMV